MKMLTLNAQSMQLYNKNELNYITHALNYFDF